jgi:hypothetical protein
VGEGEAASYWGRGEATGPCWVVCVCVCVCVGERQEEVVFKVRKKQHSYVKATERFDH